MGRSILAALLTTLSLASNAAAQTPCVEPTPALRTRPSPDGAPTRVELGVLVVDLFAVDDAKQTFDADLILTVRWKDPRLAVAGREPGSICTYAAADVWTPEPLLVNSRGASTSGPRSVQVRPDGACTYWERYTGTFSFKSDLNDFPFDHQLLTLGVVVPPRVGEVVLVTSQDADGLWEAVSIPNWTLLGMRGHVYERALPQGLQTVHAFEFGLEVERHRVYYVWKLIVPLIIVVLMSWSVLWISPKAAIQVGLGATSVLTLIAYRFATATLLPPIGYLTRLDLFLTGSSVLVLLALIEALVTVALGDQGRVETALKVDRTCRVLFPLSFLGIIVWSFWL